MEFLNPLGNAHDGFLHRKVTVYLSRTLVKSMSVEVAGGGCRIVVMLHTLGSLVDSLGSASGRARSPLPSMASGPRAGAGSRAGEGAGAAPAAASAATSRAAVRARGGGMAGRRSCEDWPARAPRPPSRHRNRGL